MGSRAPWTLSGMEVKNKPLEQEFKGFLSNLVQSPQEHARFLNMLSMLEHMGSRKIMVSQMNKTLTQEILKHLAEEARHAFFFKRQAEKTAKAKLDGYTVDNTMCRIPAMMYFGRLDASLSQKAPQGGHPETPYLWVSLIIELRACWTYHIYQDVLQEAGNSISLKSLIAEEDMHMAEMYARLQEVGDVRAEDLQDMCSLETNLFGKFWSHLKTDENLLKAA